MQLDQGEKGFSFSKEGPLDMRMDPTEPLTAREIINQWSQEKLEWIFRNYGEERRGRQAAKAILEARKKNPIETTKQLADLIVSIFGRGIKKKLHPATLIFQALRICVNHELESIHLALPKAIQALRIGGRIGVLSFHRLEDRIVKSIFRSAARHQVKRKIKQGDPAPKSFLQLVTKKPLVPSPKEVKTNPRCRSAKLRFAEKI
jgi:16S rRNA (cytosine1402-N4)-methyltransferase